MAQHPLKKPAQDRAARVVREAEMDARFAELIEQLSAKEPIEITDAEIDREIRAVRNGPRRV